MGLPRVRLLTPADLATLPGCEECGFRPDPDADWARAVQDRWGTVGVAMNGTSGVAGYALVGLPQHLPQDHPLAIASADPHAAILLALHVEGSMRRHGLARLLLTALAGKLVTRVPAIEAAGSRQHSTCQAPSRAWLEGVGFRPADTIEWLPSGARRMRLELSATLGWQVHWARALRRVVGWRPQTDRPIPEGLPRTGAPIRVRRRPWLPGG